MLNDKRPLLLLSLFTLSGFTGLIYESVWTRYLSLLLGHSAYAQTVVLIVFMGGIALGSSIASASSNRTVSPLRAYAIIEIIIGILALAFHSIYLHFSHYAYNTLFPNLSSIHSVNLYKWFSACLLILPQCILLGMTFPFMSAALIRQQPQHSGALLSWSYCCNSLGGAVGVLVAGFLWVALWGYGGTLMVAGSLNLVVGLLAAMIAYRQKQVHRSHAPVVADNKPRLRWTTLGGLLACACFTGVASFLYEIGWIRMLAMVLGSSSHAFELMLSAFILGLAIGGFWIRNRIEQFTSPQLTLSIIQIVMAILAASTLLMYHNMYDIMAKFLLLLPKTLAGYVGFNLASHAIAMLMMLPTAICAGMTLPLITALLLNKTQNEAVIGATYASNTVGCIAGVVLAMNVIMPGLGVKYVILGGALIDILVAIGLLYGFYRQQIHAQTDPHVRLSYQHSRYLAAIAICFTVGLMLFYSINPYYTSSQVFRNQGYYLSPQQYTVKYYQDGKTSTVAVLQQKDSRTALLNNGKVDASAYLKSDQYTGDEVTQLLLAIYPSLLTPQLQTVALIGFGSGLTSHFLLDNKTLSSLDTIEIEPKVVQAAKHFLPLNSNVYHDARSHIIIDDARSYFSQRKHRYHIIISEPSNPWVSGVSDLFTTEFYHLVKRHIAKHGLFVQWLQLYELNPKLLASMIKSLASVFPHFKIYASTYNDIIIVATPSSNTVPQLRADNLRYYNTAYVHSRGINSLADLQIRSLAPSSLLRPYYMNYPAPTNSDYRPYVDLNAVKARFIKSTVALSQIGSLIPLHLLYANHAYRFKTLSDSKWLNQIRLYISSRHFYLNLLNNKTQGEAALQLLLMTDNSPYSAADNRLLEKDLPQQLELASNFLSLSEQQQIYHKLKSALSQHRASNLLLLWLQLFHDTTARRFNNLNQDALHLYHALAYRKNFTLRDQSYLLGIALIADIKSHHLTQATQQFPLIKTVLSKQHDYAALSLRILQCYIQSRLRAPADTTAHSHIKG